MAKEVSLLSLCLALTILFVWTEATLVDLDGEAYFIVSRHNQERRDKKLRASNMLEMRWDKELADRAGQWSERCRYERPPRSTSRSGVGSNLYFETDHVFGKKSVHKMVRSALGSWSRSQNRFTYSSNCGRACSYVQMIFARTDRVGCALSTCEDLKSGNYVAEYASMLVCFYSPSSNLLTSFPYTTGEACSRCPSGMECRSSGLCAFPGSSTVPRELLQMADEQRRKPASIIQPQDKLSRNETTSIVLAHNKIRDAQRDSRINNRLVWDSFLERWAVWVASCEADFPGPAHTYTNFERLDQGSSVYDTVYSWSKEGYNRNLQLTHGCRTPDDRQRCNHFTNILEPELTSMACAARDCRDGTRQLICLYDNARDRSVKDRIATDELARLELQPRRTQDTVNSRRNQDIIDSRRPTWTRAQTDYRNRVRTDDRNRVRADNRNRARTDTRTRYQPYPPSTNTRYDRRQRRTDERQRRRLHRGQRIDHF